MLIIVAQQWQYSWNNYGIRNIYLFLFAAIIFLKYCKQYFFTNVNTSSTKTNCSVTNMNSGGSIADFIDILNYPKFGAKKRTMYRDVDYNFLRI